MCESESSSDAQASDGLVRLDGILCAPHVVGVHPAGGQPRCAQKQRRQPRPVAPEVPAAKPARQRGNSVRRQQEQRQMQHAHHHVQRRPQEAERDRRKRTTAALISRAHVFFLFFRQLSRRTRAIRYKAAPAADREDHAEHQKPDKQPQNSPFFVPQMAEKSIARRAADCAVRLSSRRTFRGYRCRRTGSAGTAPCTRCRDCRAAC